MLSPAVGVTLLDALTPPDGYSLDTAVGTSFTLDLVALLAVPTAFALGPVTETEDRGVARTPLALLEALRAHAGRMTVFSDQAHIKLPSTSEASVLGFLDEAVVPVQAPHPGGLFHPKLWVVRYRSASDTFLHRVLIATRNLTFDRSWDTLVRLEQVPPGTMSTAAHLPELGDTLRALPNLATQGGLTPDRHRAILDVAGTVAEAEFAIPEGFDQMVLHPIGFNAQPSGSPLPATAKRCLVVSPFLGAALPAPLGDVPDLTLVSRANALDLAFQSVETTLRPRAYILNPSLVDSEYEADEGEQESGSDSPDDTGTTLHAKLFVHDLPDERTALFTGSANATEAAFHRNTEVLLELRGPTRKVGVLEFLREPPQKADPTEYFRSLLCAHTWSAPEDVDDEKEDLLRRAQQALGRLRVTANVTITDDDLFGIEFVAAEPIPDLGGAVLEVRPITLKQWRTVGANLQERFSVSLAQLTRFLGVRLSLPDTAPVGFVIACDLRGAPVDRSDRLLAHLIADTERLVRYLLMLLTDTPEDRFSSDTQQLFDGLHRTGNDLTTFPLLEMMLRALIGSPDRLRSVGRLMEVVREHSSLADSSLLELWDAVADLVEEK